MKIAILDDYQNVVRQLNCFQLLQGHEVTVFNKPFANEQELSKALQGFQAVVLIRERTLVKESLLKLVPDLKIISQTGRPSEHIDLKACTQSSIAVLAGTGSPIAPAELTFSLIMAAQKRLPLYIDSVKQGQWQSSEALTGHIRTMPKVLKGSTLGVFGLGKIGSLVAGFGKAFGMNILVWGREGSKTKAQELGYSFASSKEEFFKQADIVTLHLRSNKETAGLVTLKDLQMMKADSILVNTSRSQLIETSAVKHCLDHKVGPYLFALDVYDQEPLLGETDLTNSERTICTPHIGFVELNSYELYFKAAFQNILDFENKKYDSVCNEELLTSLKG